MARPRLRDIAGEKFGMLTAPRYVGLVYGHSCYEFLCDCGRKVEKPGAKVVTGHVRNCGHHLRDNELLSVENVAYKKHLRAAKERGLQSFLTQAEYIAIAKRPCVYCGDVSIRKNAYTRALLPLNSVDRRDNESFYSLENSQATCFVCQKMKNKGSHKAFVEHVQKIVVKLRAG